MLAQPYRTADLQVVPPRVRTEPRVAVLLNANARKVSERTRRLLSHVVAEGDLFFSRSELDLRRIAQTVVDRRYDIAFLGGGDGTFTGFVNEIARQVEARRRHHWTPMPTFGVLKLGTGNSIAAVVNASSTRGDGILDDVLRARAGEATGRKQLDLLMVDGKRTPFVGMGIDGRLLNDYVWVKKTLGQGPLKSVFTGGGGYFASVGFKTVPYFFTHPTRVDCEVVNGRAGVAYRINPDGSTGQVIREGETIFRGKMMLACAGTVPFYGFGFKMFPFAGKKPGFMHLRLADVHVSRILANLPKLWAGEWFPEGVHNYYARDVEVRFKEPMPMQLSGDAEGARESFKISVAHEPIELVDFTSASGSVARVHNA